MKKYSIALLLFTVLSVFSSSVFATTVLVGNPTGNEVLSYDVMNGVWTLNGTFADATNAGGNGFTAPRGIATDGSNVYIATSSNILRYDTNGNYIGSVLTVSGADGLAVDSSGNLYYTVAFGGGATQGLYSITDPTGSATNSILVADSVVLRVIDFGGNGNIFVAERSAGVVTEYQTNGTLVGTFLSGVPYAQALSWDENNNRFLIGYSSDNDGFKVDIGAISTSGTLSAVYDYQSGDASKFRTNLGVLNIAGEVYGSSIGSPANAIAEVNGTTSATTVVSGVTAGYMAEVAIPEPGTVALLFGTAVLALTFWRRRAK
ncbi:MAG: PEP-CTERM sorting domain-containing protein [Verrucomicrobiota bacterium JB024]|nr:PEP-CTERM sorting domain-containing protein [Verrucomicrobiota bacterium JB024]